MNNFLTPEDHRKNIIQYRFAVRLESVRKLFTTFTLALVFSFFIGASVQAAPTQFLSPNYGIESIIFGGTGILRSSEASVPPIITTQPVVTSITTISATITWTTDKPANGVVSLGLNSGNYSQQTGQLSDTSKSTHIVGISGLKRGTLYYYRVQSADVAGNLVQSAEFTFSSDIGDIIPPKLTKGPTLTANTATSLIVTWETDKLSNSILEYGQKIVSENAVGHSDEQTTFHQVTLNGLLPQQTYILRLKDQDASGNLYISPLINYITPLAPSITNVKISDITLNSALVSWNTTAPSTSSLRYGVVSGVYDQTLDDISLTQSHLFRLANLQNGTTYYLRFAGKDGDNNALTSDEYVFKTVVLPVISNFKISELKSTTAILTWDSSSPVDALLRYSATNGPDPELIGKKLTAGDDKLVTAHTYPLSDLNGDTTYEITVLGKDFFGNQAIFQPAQFKTPPDRDPPVIENIKSDTSVNLGSGKDTVQILVSFGISKPVKAHIDYGEGAGGSFTKVVQDEGDLTRSKFLVIANLQPGQSYSYQIVATDRSGNTAKSAIRLALAPSRPTSLFDLIFGQLNKNFGFLGNIGKTQ